MSGRVRFAEVVEDDLPDLLAISLSQPEYLGLTEGSAGEHRLDLLDRNPREGYPWIGLLIVHRDHARRGLGREAAAAAVELLGGPPVRLGGPPVRLGVLDGNPAALAFWSRLGAIEVEHRDDRGGLAVMELPAT